jgi:hypothetical protein
MKISFILFCSVLLLAASTTSVGVRYEVTEGKGLLKLKKKSRLNVMAIVLAARCVLWNYWSSNLLDATQFLLTTDMNLSDVAVAALYTLIYGAVYAHYAVALEKTRIAHAAIDNAHAVRTTLDTARKTHTAALSEAIALLVAAHAAFQSRFAADVHATSLDDRILNALDTLAATHADLTVRANSARAALIDAQVKVATAQVANSNTSRNVSLENAVLSADENLVAAGKNKRIRFFASILFSLYCLYKAVKSSYRITIYYETGSFTVAAPNEEIFLDDVAMKEFIDEAILERKTKNADVA